MDDHSEASRVRAIVAPMVAQAVARGVEAVRADLQKEVRSLKRKSRLRRWDAAAIRRFAEQKEEDR
jgi:hypothetical protein